MSDPARRDLAGRRPACGLKPAKKVTQHNPQFDRAQLNYSSGRVVAANGPPCLPKLMRELRAVWAQAARVEAMRAARRAAVAEADGEATDDEAEAAAEEDELPLGCI